MNDETKVGLSAICLIIVVIAAITFSAHNNTESQYREKALAASTDIAKARLAAEPLREYGERLDKILVRLEKIERAIAIKEKP